MKKKKLNLDLEIRKLTKAVVKGEYGECTSGQSGRCKCGQNSRWTM